MSEQDSPIEARRARQRHAERRYEQNHVQLRLRLKPAEKAALDRRAAELKTRPHTLALAATRRAAGLPYLLAPELDEVKEARLALGAIGRNLNQITRKINSGEYAPGLEPALLAELAEHVETIASSVGRVVQRSRTRWAPAVKS